MSVSSTAEKSKISAKTQTLAAVLAVIAAVALPQLVHIIGAATGTHTALGEIFLPMHLPVIIAGFLAGPFAGAAAGFISPLLSSMITGMPGQAMLPFMMIELCAYGAFAGILKDVKLPCIAKVVMVQIIGRAIRAAAILFAIHALGNDMIKASVILTSIKMAVPGLVIQWALIPVIIANVKKLDGRKTA